MNSLLPKSVALLLAFSGTACAKKPGTVSYGEKVKVRAGEAIEFADFTLIFKGQRRVVPPQYPRGWWVYDFIVRSRAGEQTVSWSAGTGSIDPTDFNVGGRKFSLERVFARGAGKLAEDEVVIHRAP